MKSQSQVLVSTSAKAGCMVKLQRTSSMTDVVLARPTVTLKLLMICPAEVEYDS